MISIDCLNSEIKRIKEEEGHKRYELETNYKLELLEFITGYDNINQCPDVESKNNYLNLESMTIEQLETIKQYQIEGD